METYKNPSRNASISSMLLGAVEPAALLYFFSLMYKQQELGILCLLIMAVPGALIHKPLRVVDNWLAVFSILYVAMATVSSFMVDFNLGVYRTVQFIILTFAMIGLVKFWYLSSNQSKKRFVNLFVILNLMIFSHMILYHVISGRLTTWKYLYDTKTTISFIIIIVFSSVDFLRKKNGAFLLFVLIGILGLLVLMSGERKAYLLMGVIFIISTIPFNYKLIAGFIGGLLIVVFLLFAPADSYVKRQVSSSVGLSSQTEGLYDNYSHEELATIRDLGFQSDLIRKYVNQNAHSLFLENPFFGLGAGGYDDWANRYYGPEYTAFGIKTNVHGEINRVPVESGLFGILVAISLLSLLLVTVLRITFRYRPRNLSSMASIHMVPSYYFIFLIIYCLFEAMDTSMLSMILAFGLFMSMEIKFKVKNMKLHF